MSRLTLAFSALAKQSVSYYGREGNGTCWANTPYIVMQLSSTCPAPCTTKQSIKVRSERREKEIMTLFTPCQTDSSLPGPDWPVLFQSTKTKRKKIQNVRQLMYNERHLNSGKASWCGTDWGGSISNSTKINTFFFLLFLW